MIGGICGGNSEEDGHSAAHLGEVAVRRYGSIRTSHCTGGECIAYLYRFPHEDFGRGFSTFVFSGERQLPGACGEKEGRNEHEYRGKKVSLGKETLWSGCAQDIEYSGDCCYHKFVLVWVIVLYDSDNY